MAVRASIDAGQSSIRVRVDGHEPKVMTFPGLRNDRSTVGQVAELLSVHDGWCATSIAIGLSGYDDDPAAAGVLLAVAPSAVRVAVAHDSITGYLGANGGAPGVVAAVGTGVVVLGVGPSETARVDGWGSLLGDAGGAYWIGRAGIEAALRARDGRGRRTALTARVEEAFGPIERLALEVQADAGRVARVAAFARVVTDTAESDEVAAGIVDGAAVELAHSILTAGREAGVNTTSARISGTGQVLTSAALVARLSARLDESNPGTTLELPLGAPIDGVERLHDGLAGHPLSTSVVVAQR
ncbi:hypothetical protein OVN20_01960 [Microcella daejeonensis]|uniref:BadF/BadG/BcrA/BcrD ATPase family protein n=1 Tax=Microcella daejeonensis TaxID=2994971 RepID=UPI00226D7392|nr:BadF/BadG/BcrA/BcrD ATPase family protein [Microcella daejeonensis]WAB84362.1 hypothetical protein OVN20_01960 [Microcella daejeonensis]